MNQELRQRAKTLTSRHLSSFGEGGGEGPEEGGGLPRLPGDALHVELQGLQAPLNCLKGLSDHKYFLEAKHNLMDGIHGIQTISCPTTTRSAIINLER